MAHPSCCCILFHYVAEPESATHMNFFSTGTIQAMKVGAQSNGLRVTMQIASALLVLAATGTNPLSNISANYTSWEGVKARFFTNTAELIGFVLAGKVLYGRS